MPRSSAIDINFASFRPSNNGSGTTRSPLLSTTPQDSRMGITERFK